MTSSYEKIIINRRKLLCRSPPRRKYITLSSSSSSTTSKHQQSLSNLSVASLSSVNFLSLLKEHNYHEGGELHHVFNPNHCNTIAVCSSNYQPSSLFVCTLKYDFDSYKINEKKQQKQQHELIVRHVLTGQHDRPITSFDWSLSKNTQHFNTAGDEGDKEVYSQSPSNSVSIGANDGHIVTCGEDSRVFVWTCRIKVNGSDTPSSASWIATQVLLQQSLCMTPLNCQWDMSGENFAIGMGGNNRTASVEICSCENEVLGWSSQQIGKREIKSSVLCVAWYPRNGRKNNEFDLIACGGCDYRCRIFCTEKSRKGCRKINFGDQCAEFNTNGKGWVISVAWSSSGNYLAFSSQKSCVFIVDCSSLNQSSSTLFESLIQNIVPIVVEMNEYSPIRSILFLNENKLALGGYDGSFVTLEQQDERKWKVQVGSEPKINHISREKKHDSFKSSIICINSIQSKFKPQKEINYSIVVSGSEGRFEIW